MGKDRQKTWEYNHRPEHVKKLAEYTKEQRGAIQRFLLEIRSTTPCCDCGQLFPHYIMDFDHVRGDRRGAVSTLVSKGWKTVIEELAKCDLVCANCHKIRTHTRLGKDAL